jgi:peptidyl-prolyl cis-trans isomerase B (cyclophilin B)
MTMPNKYSAPPAMAIDPNKTYTATMKTSRGEIVLELFAKDAPMTVNNFVFLAKDKFYDGLNFHRVINDFMVQGGCPQGSGSGGPGYKFGDEVTGRANQSHKPGVISMANAGPATNGSQFFITHVDCSYLDSKHTVFGKVTKGKEEVVDKIRQGDKIESVTITEA